LHYRRPAARPRPYLRRPLLPCARHAPARHSACQAPPRRIDAQDKLSYYHALRFRRPSWARRGSASGFLRRTR